MPAELERERILSLVHEMGERLDGDWLLVGGAVVALWLEAARTTEDMDVVGISGCEEPRMALLSLAEDLGLPVETLNSAADFFVRRIAGWNEEIALLHAGSRGRIYRPSPTLFLLLKLRRLSERDLTDCMQLLGKVRAESLPLDAARVRQALDALAATDDGALRGRRERLRNELGSAGHPTGAEPA